MSAMDNLRGVVRIARAASVGVSGNGPRIERAEVAIAAVAELIEAATAATEERYHDGNSSREACDRLRAALARVQGVQS